MKTPFVLAAMLLGLLVPGGGPAAAVAPVAAAAPAASATAGASVRTGALGVTCDQSRLRTFLGDRFTFRSRIANSVAAPSDRLLAHLNVVSLTSEVYVDPEDWSSNRTREVPPLGPGGSTSLSWDLQAVNAGSFNVYVVLLPNGAASAGTGPLVVSPPVHVSVAGRRMLTAGGALPVVVAVPVLLGLVAAAARRRSGARAR